MTTEGVKTSGLGVLVGVVCADRDSVKMRAMEQAWRKVGIR
jgi:hypothetical protein